MPTGAGCESSGYTRLRQHQRAVGNTRQLTWGSAEEEAAPDSLEVIK